MKTLKCRAYKIETALKIWRKLDKMRSAAKCKEKEEETYLKTLWNQKKKLRVNYIYHCHGTIKRKYKHK